MFKALRLASASALLVGLLGVGAQGCIIGECDNGKENCIQLEPAYAWYGTEVNQTLTYTAGKNIRVDAINGHVTLLRGASTTQMTVKFMPFSLRGGDEETVAQQDMNNDLILSTDDTLATEVLIVTDRTPNGSGGLGADIEIVLPAGFDGGVTVDNGNGSIEADLTGGLPAFTTMTIRGAGDIAVDGAAGKLDVTGPFSIDVGVQAWSTEVGRVIGDRDMIFRVAPGLSGHVVAQAGSDGAVIGPSDTSWTVIETAPNHKEFTFGPDSATAGVVSLSIDGFAFANVTILQE
ncbi:MAG: hypothetical protein IT373_26675 [Polyangiaceae bacterium]|nr:hypothetical protein [Polyangiaceae bacterium]